MTDTQPDRARVSHAAAAARAQAAAAARARARADARVTPPSADTAREGAYAGLATRALALAVDAAAINFAALVVATVVRLAVSLFGRIPGAFETVLAVVGAVAYVAWLAIYFATFWSTTGQTPGARIMRIRVMDARGEAHVKPWRAVVRVVGLALATIPLFAGFLMMLWDGRRRCLQDRMARTVVIHAAPQPRIVRQRITRSG